MDTNIIVRDEHKKQIAVFSEKTRLAINKAITAFNGMVTSHGKEAAAMARRQAIAVSMMAEDPKAVKKAGFNSFGEAAAALVHLQKSNASQYRGAGDFIRNNPNLAVCGWYSPSAIYEFVAKKVPVSTIEKAVEKNALVEDMPFAAIRKWCESNSPKLLTDDEVEVVPMFAAHIYLNGTPVLTMDGTKDEVKDAMKGLIETEAAIEDDRFGSYNPHSEDADKRKGKGLVLVHGMSAVVAVLYPIKRTKEQLVIAKLKAELAALQKGKEEEK